MKRFNAIPMGDGAYVWQTSPSVKEGDERQQGIQFSVQTSALNREAALALLAADLSDQGADWLYPAGAPNEAWVLHLNRLPQFFPELGKQTWLEGERLVRPEFELTETQSFNRTRQLGIVHITALPKVRIHSASISHTPEAELNLSKFFHDHPLPLRCGFLMMPFAKTPGHHAIAHVVRETLEKNDLEALRADEHYYSDELLPNIRTYMHACGFGVAVFERLTQDQFNPNVSLEVGYMMALGKPICLLKDSNLPSLPSDLVGRLYEDFDVQRIPETLPLALIKWLRQKGLASGQ